MRGGGGDGVNDRVSGLNGELWRQSYNGSGDDGGGGGHRIRGL